MLNGAHSMLAYAGFIAGHRYVRDCMADPDLASLIRRHMSEAARTLDPVPGIDLGAICKRPRSTRFANPAIAHETWQIAMDGTQKLPQRLIEPAMIALERGLPLEAYAFAVAAWMRYALGMKENGEKYALRDPREAGDRRADRRASALPARLSTGCSACPDFSPRNWRARTNGRTR